MRYWLLCEPDLHINLDSSQHTKAMWLWVCAIWILLLNHFGKDLYLFTYNVKLGSPRNIRFSTKLKNDDVKCNAILCIRGTIVGLVTTGCAVYSLSRQNRGHNISSAAAQHPYRQQKIMTCWKSIQTNIENNYRQKNANSFSCANTLRWDTVTSIKAEKQQWYNRNK